MKKGKNVIVVYDGDDWSKKIPLESAVSTRKAFEDWQVRALQEGIEMYRASIHWYNLEQNVFEKAWAYRGKRWIKVEEPIKPSLIFDKIAGHHDYELFAHKMAISEKTKIFNHPLFRTMVNNKLSQYLALEEFMPKSFMATSRAELGNAVDNITSTKVVLKPLYGSGGFGIMIEEKAEILKSDIEYPVLIQEFIKSRGIPGFSDGREIADLRMVYMNHELVYALSRIAKEGSLFTNFHQGAKAVLVPEDSIPEEANKVAEAIIKKLSIFPEANYSLDFIFNDQQQPMLLEMNTTPGFDLLYELGDEEAKEKNYREFIKMVD